MSTFLSLTEWKAKAAAGEQPGAVVKYFVPDEIKAVEGVARTLQFTISTEAVDRDGDTIKATGWDISNYLKNPVVLYGHDYHGLPIGKAERTWAVNGALKSQAEFATRDIYPMADTVYQMLLAGYLRATSVGFKPKDGEYNFDQERGGVNFLKQELLEYSVVPVPSNPQALIEARGAGINIDPLKEWAEQILDTWHQEKGVWVSKAQVEKVFSLIETRTISIPSISEETIKAVAEHGLRLDIVGDIAQLRKHDPKGESSDDLNSADFVDKGVTPADVSDKTATEDLTVEIPLDDVVKAVVDEVVEKTDALQKAGRTISAMHEGHLKTAVDCIQKVLSSLDTEPDNTDANEGAEDPEQAPMVGPHKDVTELAAFLAAIDETEKDAGLHIADEDLQKLLDDIQVIVNDKWTQLTGRLN